MIELLVLGQPYWGRHMVRDLTAHAPDIRARFVPQGSYLRLLASPPRHGPVLLLRVGFRVGATTPRGRLFDAYWGLLRRAAPRATAVHYWLGTDVLSTLDEASAGTLRRSAVDASRGDLHLAAAPWLVTELETVGLEATLAHVQPVVPAPSSPPPLPPELRVLTYLPAARFEFYGGPAIVEAARALPDVGFDVVGGDASPVPGPPNVRWHGWVSDMAERYANATVVVRLPRHDAFGGTVVEGLFNARHVVYSYDVPFVRRLAPVTAAALTSVLGELRDAHRAGRLGLNLDGRAYALAEFDETRVANHLAGLLRARA